MIIWRVRKKSVNFMYVIPSSSTQRIRDEKAILRFFFLIENRRGLFVTQLVLESGL